MSRKLSSTVKLAEKLFGNLWRFFPPICTGRCQLDRDKNAAKNISNIGLSPAGHSVTLALDILNAWGDLTSTLAEEIGLKQVES
jgi:hypothetical protein